MRKLFGLMLAASIAMSAPAFAQLDVEIVDLPADRTSMEYGSQIKALEKVIAGYKWVGENGSGFTMASLPELSKKSRDDYTANGLFYELKKYYYQGATKTSTLYARQSVRVGFVEFVDIDERSTMNIRVIDANTIEIFENAKDKRESARMIYKKVAQFQENPSKMNKLKSAKDAGMVF